MSSWIRAALLAAFAVAVAAPAAAQTAAAPPVSHLAPAPPPAPTLRNRAVEWFARMELGKPDRTQLSPTLSAKLTDGTIARIGSMLRPYGPPQSIRYLGGRMVGTDRVYAYLLSLKTVDVREMMALDGTGKISGLVFTILTR